MSVSPTAELERLLADDRWIRRLARRLVGDPGAAEDLVQETWLAAWTRAARGWPVDRAWLGRVLRNTWKDLLRGRARRERRERVVARAEASGGADELAAELELRERVARALRELEEPYRRTLVLRFLRDESLASIAQRENLAVSTVHERIQRGLARLRARLDADHGGRRQAWSAALVSLARRAGAGTGAFEVAAMAGALKIAASVLVVGAGVAWWWSGRDRSAAPRAGAPLAEAVPGEVLELGRAPERAGAAREPLATAAAPALPGATGEPASPAITGRVLDVEGRGVAGALVGWRKAREGEEAVSTAAGGAYELAHDGRSLVDDESVVCNAPELVTLIPGRSYAGWTVVVAQRASFAGVVVDPSGAPIPGAALEFRLRETAYRAVGLHAMGADDERWSTTSDDLGRFELGDVAGGPSFLLAARARGFVEAEVALSGSGDPAMVVTLQPRAGVVQLTGIVLDPAGAPVAGASVSAGEDVVTTGADGRFELSWDGGNGNWARDERGTWREDGVERASVMALKEGFLPAQEALRERDLGAPFTLVLAPARQSITGSVLDPGQRPLAGIVLWVQEATRFGRERTMLGDGTEIPRFLTVEGLLCGGSEPAAISAVDGSFELGCLMSRSYSVVGFDPRTASRCGPWIVPAGTVDVELVFTPEPTARVAGRVVSARGTPRAGMEIVPRRSTSWATGAQAPQLHGAQYGVTTDADGRFEFAELALAGTSLLLSAPPFTMRVVELADVSDLARIELVEPERCEVQVELAGDPGAADRLRMLDAAGAELELGEVAGRGNSIAFTMETEVGLVGGRSRLLLVSETARTLVLYEAGIEVLRVPVRLEPGQKTVLRP